MTQIIDLGKLRFNFAGEYDPGVTYELNDIVKFGGNIYIYTSQIRTVGSVPTNEVYWQLMVSGLAWQGVWVKESVVSPGNVYAHRNGIYVATKESVGQEPDAHPELFSELLVGIRWRGDYEAATSYSKDDIVRVNGRLYMALKNSVGADVTDDLSWKVLIDALNYTGVFSSVKQYQIGDLVGYGGNIYRASAATLGNLPTNALFWDVYTSGLSFKSTWNELVAYKVGEVVTHGANTYRCIADTEPGLTVFTETHWELFTSAISFDGEWNELTAYKVGAIVSHGANKYRSLTDVAAGVSPLNTDYWELFAQSFRLRGQWQVLTQYLTNDVVSHGGHTYICSGEHVSSSEFATDSTAWKKFNGGFNWRGEWQSGAEYASGDVVYSHPSTYLCEVDHVAGEIVDDAKFTLLAKGVDNLPDQVNQDGKVLSTTGTETRWIEPKLFLKPVSANLIAVDGGNYLCDTSAGSFTVTLPVNPTAGAAVKIFDAGDSFNRNPLKVNLNGENFEGISNESLLLDVMGADVTLIFMNATTGWRLY